jgi:very-short-patch-repair endonuclease
MKYVKRVCDKCNREVAINNFNRHYKRCGITYELPSKKDIAYIPKMNLGRIPWNYGKTSKDDLRISTVSKPCKDDVKLKISESMKTAHAEGRAWNIGMSRWNNEPSYPETWFMKVISNEFSDKNYIREFPFSKYSIDFAWPHLKKAIEIDGEQHQRFPEYAERDRIKDSLLLENGWLVLRMSWKTINNNTLNCIQQLKKFIDYNS